MGTNSDSSRFDFDLQIQLAFNYLEVLCLFYELSRSIFYFLLPIFVY